MGCKTTVIAEIGENHLGNMDVARQMIVTAAEAGAHVVKFHTLMPGTDHLGAVTPQDLADLTRRLERVEKMLGSGRKAPTEKEIQVMPIMRNRFGA